MSIIGYATVLVICFLIEAVFLGHDLRQYLKRKQVHVLVRVRKMKTASPIPKIPDPVITAFLVASDRLESRTANTTIPVKAAPIAVPIIRRMLFSSIRRIYHALQHLSKRTRNTE